MPEHIYLSASLVKDWLECQRKVFYRVYFPSTASQSGDMVVGTLVHTAIEKFWDSKENALKFVEGESLSLGLDEKYQLKARQCVENFFPAFSAYLGEDDLIEYKFKLPFLGSSFIVGKIDRITSTGGIIDWKASKCYKKSSDNSDPQLIIYSYVYEKIFQKDPSFVMKAHLLDCKIDAYMQDKILEYSIINGVMPSIIESFQAQRFQADGLFSGKCHRCQYAGACKEDLGY